MGQSESNIMQALYLIAAILVFLAGETLEAFFAGEREARRTIRKPTTIPANMPAILNSNNGTSEKRSPLMDPSNRQAAHVTIWPASRPMGTPLFSLF